MDLIIILMCFYLCFYYKDKLYFLLGTGIFCGIIYLYYILCNYSGYMRRCSVFIYVLFFLLTCKLRREK